MRARNLRLTVAIMGLAIARVSAQTLPIVKDGKAQVVICVHPKAGHWESRAAIDLVAVIEKITSVAPPLIQGLASEGQPAIVVGQLALPQLQARLPKEPHQIRQDSIALYSQPGRLWLAGSNDDSHYFAVAELMRRWGCRWYMPTEFGACIPQQAELLQPPLDYAYTPPFEIRSYWLSWNGDRSDYENFAHRNFMNLQRFPAGHSLSQYLKDLPGGLQATSQEQAEKVAVQLESGFAAGQSQSVSIEDATVALRNPSDQAYQGQFWDKYFQAPVVSDAYLLFYNRVCQWLQRRHPHSKARLGFLAYVNLTLPPQRAIRAAQPLICYLAPIDVDPNHSDSAPKNDYWGAVQRWTQVMQGRVIVYDYDQSMLVWRDLPNPSHHVVQQDLQKYRKLGILGIDTESRGATATTFLNLYFRGQLMWNPDLDVAAELQDFYPKFFGPVAIPMKGYWGEIFQAWKETSVLEHEYFVIPHVYTEERVEKLKGWLTSTTATRVEGLHAQRLRFVQLSFDLIRGYTQQLEAESRCEYGQAIEAGRQALRQRELLTEMNPTFTTYRNMPESGPAFWPGELDALEELRTRTHGPVGQRVLISPSTWDFRLDPDDHGLWQNWSQDLLPWSAGVSVDRYLLPSNAEPRHGFAWYRWRFRLSREQAQGPLVICFPGLFNESWLYQDGNFLEFRPQRPLWWNDDYRFRWEVPLHLEPGEHWLTLRTRTTLHLSGLFRRPFLYRRRPAK